MTELTANVSKSIKAPIESVFDAWLNPKLLSQFMLPMPGMPEPETIVDAQIGGTFTIIMQVGDEKMPHTGEYLVLDRPHKLVFSWISPFSPVSSTVTLDFTAEDDQTTHIKLVHSQFTDEESRSNHQGGWSNILDALSRAI